MLNKRILIVDDHEAILEIIEEALIYENYEVCVIRFGSQFFVAVADFKPDLILLDYVLADNNGGDLCKELKANPEFAHIPVIISSAYFIKGSHEPPPGCDGILYKPFNLEDLLDMVKYQVNRLTTEA